MAVIFLFSSIPSDELPSFDWADFLIKKGGHALGYGLLALSYWHGLSPDRHGAREGNKMPFAPAARVSAWLLTVLYAVSDELHQSFVPGRHASVWDVMIDALGAALALWLADHSVKRLRRDAS